jgi:hypothetical protein
MRPLAVTWAIGSPASAARSTKVSSASRLNVSVTSSLYGAVVPSRPLIVRRSSRKLAATVTVPGPAAAKRSAPSPRKPPRAQARLTRRLPARVGASKRAAQRQPSASNTAPAGRPGPQRRDRGQRHRRLSQRAAQPLVLVGRDLRGDLAAGLAARAR